MEHDAELIAVLLIAAALAGGLLLRLAVRSRRRRFCRAHEYRVFGKVISSRQVYGSRNLRRWELTVQYQDDLGEMCTATVTTADAHTAGMPSVELAVIPSKVLAGYDTKVRMDLMRRTEQGACSPEQMRETASDVFAQREAREKSPLLSAVRNPVTGIAPVRLWDERETTSEARQKLSARARDLLAAAGAAVGGIALCILVVLLVFPLLFS